MMSEPFYEEKLFDNVLYFRTNPIGGWFKKKVRLQRIKPPKHPIDDLLNEAQRRLGLINRGEVLNKIGVMGCTISRIRAGDRQISSDLILKFYDVAGISIEDSRRIGQIKPLL